MINNLLVLLFPFLYFKIIISQYSIVQSQHYEFKKYLLYQKNNKLIFSVLSLFVFFISLFINNKVYYILIVFSLILGCAFFINKNKIKITNRVKRFILIYFLVSYLLAILFNIYNLMLIVSCFVLEYLYLVHYLSMIIEMLIRKKYIKEAKKIVKKVKVIGITGSYGKTSCKNIVYDILSQIYNVSKTPKSYNTEIGIIKSIRENIDVFDEYFICEYGVDRVGGMDKLLKIAKPNISLITEVGKQHLLTFKNINNIKKEKLKIAKILQEDECAIINNDNIYLNDVKDSLKCKVITYGIKNNSDIMAKNILIDNKGSSFDLYVNNKKVTRLKICLLGEHNIKNILGAIGVIKSMDIPLNDLDKLVRKVKQIEHRLELKKIDNIKVIDDSFNSNEEGFKKAIDVLSMMKEKKIVITPGVIEQGSNSNQVNYKLGEYMAKKVDLVILVEKNSTIMKKGLLNKGFNEDNILIKNNFLEAWGSVKKIKEDKIILIENDLPSIYLK